MEKGVVRDAGALIGLGERRCVTSRVLQAVRLAWLLKARGSVCWPRRGVKHFSVDGRGGQGISY